MRLGLYLIAALSLLVGLFYAFNAYIQLRERGFAEPTDIPIAVLGIVVAGALFVVARRRSTTDAQKS